MALPPMQTGRPFSLYKPSYSLFPVVLSLGGLGMAIMGIIPRWTRLLEIVPGVIAFVRGQVARVEPRV